MKLAWLTDIHLNFLDLNARNDFYHKVKVTPSDAVLISGDIAEANSITEILTEMAVHIKKPIYFVLGNHDYYKGQVDIVRKAMTALTKKNEPLYWLPALEPQTIAENIILLGQDGWADGRLGDYQNSRASLNDSRLIADLWQQKLLGKNQLLQKMQQLADDDASKLKNDLKKAIGKQPKQIIVLTHVPPFREASTHEGKISNDDYLPFFSSKASGDVLTTAATENPNIQFLVLCGHTHSACTYIPLTNLTVKAGAAAYFRPEIQEVIDISVCAK